MTLANEDISEADWLDLYRHVLAQLNQRGLNELRAEIESAAAAPVVEASSPEDQERVSKLVRGEIGKVVVRRRNPREVFDAALGVLQTRLIELPAVADRVAALVKVPASQIEFRVDYEERYTLVGSRPIALTEMVLDERDHQAITKTLVELGASEERMKV